MLEEKTKHYNISLRAIVFVFLGYLMLHLRFKMVDFIYDKNFR